MIEAFAIVLGLIGLAVLAAHALRLVVTVARRAFGNSRAEINRSAWKRPSFLGVSHRACATPRTQSREGRRPLCPVA